MALRKADQHHEPVAAPALCRLQSKGGKQIHRGEDETMNRHLVFIVMMFFAVVLGASLLFQIARLVCRA